YDGWQATVNGKPHPILMTNGAFRGFALSAGTSEIVMEYHPAHFTLAWLITLLSLGGTMAMAVRGVSWHRAVAEIVSGKEAIVAWARSGGEGLRIIWTRRLLPRREAIGWAALLLL